MLEHAWYLIIYIFDMSTINMLKRYNNFSHDYALVPPLFHYYIIPSEQLHIGLVV